VKILIKLGGTLLDLPDSRARLAAEIVEISRAHAVVVVHGGGKQMTRYLAEHNVESRFVNGLRVTTPEVVDAVLKVFAGSGYLPVVACVAGDAKGAVYNVNADQMAVACAASFGAEKLLFLTDVDGVKGAQGEWLDTLSVSGATSLIAAGVATGGMQAKLEAAAEALRAGVKEVMIAPGAKQKIVHDIMSSNRIGTRLYL
jgi:acetylglutamate kinase